MWHWSWMSLPANCGRLWLGVVEHVLGWGLTLVVLSWVESGVIPRFFLLQMDGRNLKEVYLEYPNRCHPLALAVEIAAVVLSAPGSQLRTRGQKCANVCRELWWWSNSEDPQGREFFGIHPQSSKNHCCFVMIFKVHYTNITRFTVHLMGSTP